MRDVLTWWEDSTVRFSPAVHGSYADAPETFLHTCPSCHFGIFRPTIVGTAEFYADLASTAGAWYYSKDKWEYDQALLHLAGCASVLEIGSGEGFFLEKLSGIGARGLGLELNPRAASAARAKGLDVRETALDTFATSHAGEFDAAVMFQLLEHVADPFQILRSARACLRPGGKLIVSVPSDQGVIRIAGPMFTNVPPHHVTRWTIQTFRSAAARLGMTLTHSAHEPLWHYGMFSAGWSHYFGKVMRWDPKRSRALSVRRGVHWLGLQYLRVLTRAAHTVAPKGIPFLPGHSLYVVFQMPTTA